MQFITHFKRFSFITWFFSLVLLTAPPIYASPSSQDADPNVNVIAGTVSVKGDQIILPVTLINSHKYAIYGLSLSAVITKQSYSAGNSGLGNIVVNGQELQGSYITSVVRIVHSGKTLDLPSSGKISTEIQIPIINGDLSTYELSASVADHAGVAVGTSKKIDFPKEFSVSNSSTLISVSDFHFVSATGSNLGNTSLQSDQNKASLSFTLNNSGNTATIQPQIQYYRPNKFVNSSRSDTSITPYVLQKGQTHTFTVSLPTNLPAGDYQVGIDTFNDHGILLVTSSNSNLLRVSGSSALIHNVILSQTNNGTLDARVFTSSSIGTIGEKLSVIYELVGSKVLKRSQQNLMPNSNNQIAEDSLSFTYKTLFAKNLTYKVSIKDAKGNILDTVSLPVTVRSFMTIQILLLLLLITILVSGTIYLLNRFVQHKYSGLNVKKGIAGAVLTGIIFMPFFLPRVQAGYTTQTTPISANLSSFVMRNTGISVASQALGSASGADSFGTVVATDGTNSGGVALSEIEVAPGWGKDWSFAHGDNWSRDPKDFDKVQCNSKSNNTSTYKGWVMDKITADEYPDATDPDRNQRLMNPWYSIDFKKNTAGQDPCHIYAANEPANASAVYVSLPPYYITGQTDFDGNPVPDTYVDPSYYDYKTFGPFCKDVSNYGSKQYETNYNSSCYVLTPKNVDKYNPDWQDMPMPLYGIQGLGDYNNFFSNYSTPAITVNLPQKQDLTPCSANPAFVKQIGKKENIDSSANPDSAGFLASVGVAYPTIQSYPRGSDDAAATAYIVAEPLRSGSLRYFVAACVKAHSDGTPSTTKIGFDVHSHQYKFTGSGGGHDDSNGYARSLVNDWTFQNLNRYDSHFDGGYYQWGNKASRQCVGLAFAGCNKGHYENVIYERGGYPRNAIDNIPFYQIAWRDDNPLTTNSSRGNDWIGYDQTLTQTCNQFVFSTVESPYTGSSNPGLTMPVNQTVNSIDATTSASANDFKSSYGRDCSVIPSISTNSTGGNGPTAHLSLIDNGANSGGNDAVVSGTAHSISLQAGGTNYATLTLKSSTPSDGIDTTFTTPGAESLTPYDISKMIQTGDTRTFTAIACNTGSTTCVPASAILTVRPASTPTSLPTVTLSRSADSNPAKIDLSSIATSLVALSSFSIDKVTGSGATATVILPPVASATDPTRTISGTIDLPTGSTVDTYQAHATNANGTAYSSPLIYVGSTGIVTGGGSSTSPVSSVSLGRFCSGD